MLKSHPAAWMPTLRPAIPLESKLERARLSAYFQNHSPNVCKIADLPLQVGLTDSCVLWWKAMQDDVLVLPVRGALIGDDEIRRSWHRSFL